MRHLLLALAVLPMLHCLCPYLRTQPASMRGCWTLPHEPVLQVPEVIPSRKRMYLILKHRLGRMVLSTQLASLMWTTSMALWLPCCLSVTKVFRVFKFLSSTLDVLVSITFFLGPTFLSQVLTFGFGLFVARVARLSKYPMPSLPWKIRFDVCAPILLLALHVCPPAVLGHLVLRTARCHVSCQCAACISTSWTLCFWSTSPGLDAFQALCCRGSGAMSFYPWTLSISTSSLPRSFWLQTILCTFKLSSYGSFAWGGFNTYLGIPEVEVRRHVALLFCRPWLLIYGLASRSNPVQLLGAVATDNRFWNADFSRSLGKLSSTWISARLAWA